MLCSSAGCVRINLITRHSQPPTHVRQEVVYHRNIHCVVDFIHGSQLMSDRCACKAWRDHTWLLSFVSKIYINRCIFFNAKSADSNSALWSVLLDRFYNTYVFYHAVPRFDNLFQCVVAFLYGIGIYVVFLNSIQQYNINNMTALPQVKIVLTKMNVFPSELGL